MKTVKQQAEVSFKLLDFADKVVMLPIMNMLTESVKADKNMNIMIEETDASTYLTPIETKKILKVLSDLGCRTSLGESYEDIVKSDNSQEKEERCILHLFDLGKSRLDVIKVIKDYLNISATKAQNIINICPTDIDLRTFNIAQNKYVELLKLLTEKGCSCSLKLNTDRQPILH